VTSTTPVDDLITDLGDLRVKADAAHADAIARRAIEEAIWEATRAISAAIQAPESEPTLSLAQATLRRTARLIYTLEAEIARSRRNASRAAGLGQRIQARHAAKAHQGRS